MQTINNEIFDIAAQASLKITVDNNNVDIKHKFRLGDKSFWGVLFFLFGCFLIAAPFIKTSNTTSKVIGVTIGLLFLTLSILSLIRQAADSLKITGTEIKFRYNLRRTTIPLGRHMTVEMKTEIMKIRRFGTLGSDFIIISYYLQDLNSEIPILKFQMDNFYADKARKLGNGITQIVNDKIRQIT
ncbi:hypothetical protein [Chitinophaga sp. YIM B06452]|uniref:hypothetical protein n=1 Tax=Chitinophaga sp. YIM B06452 TaxID=3082158 RepID=UPI0031FF19FC